MPRTGRVVPDNSVQHIINRGNKREPIFREPADYKDFFCLLAETCDRVPMRILDVCLMTNHFHLLLWPENVEALSAYMTLFMNAQIRRLQKRHGTVGLGHIYQGRYKNFTVQDDAHLCRVSRYVVANPLRAGMVSRAEEYSWSSLSRRLTPDGRRYLSEGPVAKPPDWCDYVNRGIDSAELEALRNCARRGTPYGDEGWVERTVSAYGLESTVRRPGHRR